MDQRFTGNFRKPRSMLGRRSRSSLLNENNDSRLEPISESAAPTPTTSRVCNDESLLGYDSLCDDTLKTPSSYKFSSGDFFRTPSTYTSLLRRPAGYTGSHKKTPKPEVVPKRSVKLQASLDNAGTPPHILRRRLQTASSAFVDLEEEYKQLTEFTTLEKQILSVEAKLQKDNDMTERLRDIEAVHERKEANWKRREEELSQSLQDAWNSLEKSRLENEALSCGKSLEDNQLKFAQDLLLNKVKILTNLQNQITEKESIFISELEQKSLVISELADKTKTNTKQMKSLNKKVKELDQTLEDRESKIVNLQYEFKSFKDTLLDGYSLMINCLNDNINDSNIFDNQLFEDLKITMDKLSTGEIGINEVMQISHLKFVNLIKEFINLKQDTFVKQKTLNDQLTEKEMKIISDSEELKTSAAKIEELINEVQTKNDTIKDLNVKLNEKEKILFELKKEMEDINKEFERKTNNFDELSKEMDKIKIDFEVINIKLAETERNATDLSDKLTEKELDEKKNKTVEEVENALKEKIYESEKLYLDLKQKEDVIQSMNNYKIESQNKINYLNNLLEEKSQELILINDSKINSDKLLKEKETELNRLFSICSGKDLKIVSLKKELLKCNENLENINSLIETNEKLIFENTKKHDDLVQTLKNQIKYLENELKYFRDEHLKMKDFEAELLHFKSQLYSFASNVGLNIFEGKSFEQIINKLDDKFKEYKDLIEHYKNRITSKEEVYSEKIKCFKKNQNHLVLYGKECEKKVGELEISCSHILDKALNEIALLESSNKSKTESLEILIKDLQKQLETKSCELDVKDEKLITLNNKLIYYDQDMNNFLNNMALLGLTPSDNPCSINSYNNSIEYVKNKLDQTKDLIEHLRNVIYSKDEKIFRLSDEIEMIVLSKFEERENISCLEESVLLLKDKLNDNSLTLEIFLNKLNEIIPEFNLDPLECQTWEQMIIALKSNFIKQSELEEHLKNTIQSKIDKIDVLNGIISSYRSTIDDLKAQLVDVSKENSGFKNELNYLKETEVNALNEIDRLKNSKSRLNEQYENDLFDLNTLKEGLSKLLNDHCNTPEEMIKFFEAKLNHLEDLREHFKNVIQSKDDQINELSIKISRSNKSELNLELINLKLKIDSFNEKDIMNNEKVINLENKIKNFEHLLESKAEELILMRDLLINFSSSVDTFKENVDLKMKQKDDQLSILNDQVNLLKRKLISYNDLEIRLSDIQEKLEMNTVASLQSTQNETKYLNQCTKLKYRISDLEEQIELKTKLIISSEEKIEMLSSCLSNVKVSLKDELKNALNTLDDFEIKQEENLNNIANFLTRHNKLEDYLASLSDLSNKFVEEKDNFLSNLQKLFNNFGFNSQILSYDDATCEIDLKFNELFDFKEHLKNVIQSKDDQLKSLKDQITIKEVQKNVEDYSITDSNIKTECSNSSCGFESRLLKDNVANCYTKLVEIVSFLNPSKTNMDDNFEVLLNILNNNVHELTDKIEHLRNIICSKDEKLSRLVVIESNKSKKKLLSIINNYDCELVETRLDLETLRTDLQNKEELIENISRERSLLKEDQIANNAIIEKLEQTVTERMSIIKSKDNYIEELSKKIDICNCETDYIKKQIFFDKFIQSISSVSNHFERSCNDTLLESYDDVILCLQDKMSYFNDLIEHLRNKIISKDEQLDQVSLNFKVLKQQYSNNNQKAEHQFYKDQVNSLKSFLSGINSSDSIDTCDEIIQLVKNKFTCLKDQNDLLRSKIESKEDQLVEASNLNLILKDQIKISASENESFFNFIQTFSSTNLEECKVNSFEDVRVSLERKFSDINDLNEHLRNKIISKKDQLNEISNNITILKEELHTSQTMIDILKDKLANKTEEFQLLKIEGNEKEIFIDLLQEKINLMNKEVEIGYENFSKIKQEAELKITELKDLKEHSDNKLQSKIDKLSILSKEFLILKEKCSLYENTLLETPISSELSNKLADHEKYISHLEKEMDIKNLEIKNSKVKLSDAVKQNNFQHLDTKLCEAYKELDTYKTNELTKDNSILKLNEQVSELKSCLNAKTKEVSNYNDSMDRLSQNIVELIRDKDVFFDQLKIYPSFSNVKTFDDILENAKTVHLELLQLKGTSKISVSSLEEVTKKLTEKDNTLILLKGDNDRIVSELNCYKEKQEEFDVLVDEIDGILDEISPLYLSNTLSLSDMCIKEKIVKIRNYIVQLEKQLKEFECELDKQTVLNETTKAFVDDANNAIYNSIASTNNIIENLSTEMSNYKTYFDEKFKHEQSEIEILQKEVYLSLEGIKDLVDVSGKQNEDIISLSNAYLNLHSDYESSVNNFKICLQTFCDTESKMFNEYEVVSQDLMIFVNDLLANNVISYNMLNTNEDFSSIIDVLSEKNDELHMDLFNLIKDFKQDQLQLIEQQYQENDLVVPVNDIEIESTTFFNPINCAVDDVVSRLFQSQNFIPLVDSIKEENKLINETYSCIIKIIQEDPNQIENRLKAETITNKNNIYPTRKSVGADMSIFTSVVDQTCIESLNSSTCSNGKNYNICTNYNSPQPEKTFYILPDTLNACDSYVEKTLVLPNKASSASSAHFKCDKTVASSGSAWLNFDNNLDESGAEFLDAQDSIGGIDPLSTDIEEQTFKPRETPVQDHLLNLKLILGLETSCIEDVLSEVKDMADNISLVKASIKEYYPEIENSNLYLIFKALLDKILELKTNLKSSDKHLLSSLSQTKKSLEELKGMKNAISTDLKLCENFVFNDLSLIYKTLQSNHKIISTKSDNLKNALKDHMDLKVSFNNCLKELDSIQKDNLNLTSSLQDNTLKLEEYSIKNEELLNENKNVTDVVNNLKEVLDIKNNEIISLKNDVDNLNSRLTSSKDIFDENENKLKEILLENNNLLSELTLLKDQINSGSNICDRLEQEISKVAALENKYSTLKTTHDELLEQFFDAQKKIETFDRSNTETLFNCGHTINEIKIILKILELDENFNSDKKGLTHALSKIQNRITLLKEHREVVDSASSDVKLFELNQKIRSLENEIYNTNNFKLSFSKELHSLNSDFNINDLLKKPFAELHALLLNEIMSRENVIINNLKTSYDEKISSLKEEINQLVEKDKRRVDWVSEVESDNENLNALTKKLKEDYLTVTEKLDSKLFFEKHILTAIQNLDEKLNNKLTDEINKPSNIDLDIIKKGELSGEILSKLQNMVKKCLPYGASSHGINDNYKETINNLEEKCEKLQKQIYELEESCLKSNKEINDLKNELNEKADSHVKELEFSKQNMISLKNTIDLQNEKLKMAEERYREESEQLQREKEFSLRIKEENNYTKQQLENHIDLLTKINLELNDAKVTFQLSVSKHEEEIASLMKVISNLELELKCSHSSEEAKGVFEQKLIEANKKIFEMEKEFTYRIDSLEDINKTLKNSINLRQKEIEHLKEEHSHEIKILKLSLNDSLDSCSSLKSENENYIGKIHQLEKQLTQNEALYRDSLESIARERDDCLIKIKSLEEFSTKINDLLLKLQVKDKDLINQISLSESILCEKEAQFRSSICSILREKENDTDKIKYLEECFANCRGIISQLENRVIEMEEMYERLQNSFTIKESDYQNRIQQLERSNEELGRKIELIKNNLIQKVKEHDAEVNLLNDKINQYLLKINQLEGKESCESFNEELLKLFPECSSCSNDLLNIIKTRLAEISTLKEELEDKTSEYRYLEEDCDEMIKLVKDYQWKLGESCRVQYEDENKFKTNLAEKDALIENLQSQIAELKKKDDVISSLESNVRALDSRIKTTELTVASLTKENSSLKILADQKPECKECKELMEQVIHFKAKLKVTEEKLNELSKGNVDTSFDKDNIAATLKKKIFELERENFKLVSQVISQPSSVLKDIHNQQSAEQLTSKVTKLENRIVKLEKDRGFLKKVCDKRSTVINNLTHELESLKKNS